MPARADNKEGTVNIFFIADTHFEHCKNKHGFGGIIFHAKRPFASLEEMDATLISNWNEMVKPGDHTWVLGDFAWRNHSKYLHALNGKKFLVKGSHDKMPHDTLRLFAEVHEGMAIRNFNKSRMVLTHCPMLTWEGSAYRTINLHGHCHGRIVETDNCLRMDVGVDVWGFKPVPLELVIAIMSKRDYMPRRSLEEVDANVAILAKRNASFKEEFKNI